MLMKLEKMLYKDKHHFITRSENLIALYREVDQEGTREHLASWTAKRKQYWKRIHLLLLNTELKAIINILTCQIELLLQHLWVKLGVN